MCGRFFEDLTQDEIRGYFDVAPADDAEVAPTPRYNIGPGQAISVVRRDKKTGARRLEALHWGLVPHFASDRKGAYRAINARAESVERAPLFRQAFEKRRCLVVARGFYEWRPQPRQGAKSKRPAKQPFAIARSDGAPLAFAGVWENWLDKATGEWLRSVAIVTTAASPELARLHDRMPVILGADAFARWLGEEPAETAQLKALLAPSGEPLRIWPVSARVNRTEVDEPSILEPFALDDDPSAAGPSEP